MDSYKYFFETCSIWLLNCRLPELVSSFWGYSKFLQNSSVWPKLSLKNKTSENGWLASNSLKEKVEKLTVDCTVIFSSLRACHSAFFHSFLFSFFYFFILKKNLLFIFLKFQVLPSMSSNSILFVFWQNISISNELFLHLIIQSITKLTFPISYSQGTRMILSLYRALISNL